MSETKSGHVLETNRENKETGPKITVDFFFSAHETAEDVNRLPEALKNADVYVPEAVGWTKKDEQLINQVSQGKTKLQAPTDSALETEASLLYNSKISVIFIDLPKGHPLIKEDRDTATKMHDAYQNFILGNFDEAIKIKKTTTADEVLIIKARENFIADKLKKELKTLTKKFPQLKNKTDIRVLVTLGAVHTPMYQKLRPELPSSKMLLGKDTFVFSTGNEIIRRLIKNPQEAINDDLYAEAMLEEFIGQFFIYNITNNDANKTAWASRKLVANLSVDQIRSFSKAAGNLFGEMSMIQSEDVLHRRLIKKLKELGINLPTTEAEVDELINLKKIKK